MDTKKTDGVTIHFCRMVNGTLKKGDTVRAEINEAKRVATMRNHSAAHLLQAALRTVLGKHVEQAGSYVDEHHVRFDFTHFAAVTPEELRAVESLVNSYILLGEPVTTTLSDIESAKKMGAMALFGEKYGDVVRVVKMGEFSTELCGGTHVDNTAKLGLFKITSESSVAAGVRRIEGVTGIGVLALLGEKDKLIKDTAEVLKAPNAEDLVQRAKQLTEELRSVRHELEAASEKLAASKATSLVESAEKVGNVRLICAKVEMKPDAMRALTDKFKAEYADVVCVLAAVNDGKVNFAVSCGKDAVAGGANAGKIVKQISTLCGGGGGGRPDSASAGGKDASKLDEALATVASLLG